MCEPLSSSDALTKSKTIELEDLLAFYPDVEDKNIQQLITKKKEFADLASNPMEKIQSPYYSHQLLVQRFLESYDELFLFHDTGTGKSRILDLIGEHFRRNKEKNKQIQKVLVLVRSDILKSEIEKQIVASCNDGTYDVGESCPKARKRALRRKISEWYTIASYQKLAKTLKKMDDETIVREFSGHLIFFDEVHNIRVEDKRGSKNRKVPNRKVGNSSRTRKGEFRKRTTYEQIYRLFHLPKNTKRVIATATPMVNDVREIGPIMNLILPKDKNFPPDFPYETASYEDYEPYFRGRVSYVRSLDTGIRIRHIGIPVNEIKNYEYSGKFGNPQIKVFPNYMSEFQNRAYLRASALSRRHTKSTFYHAERQSSNFVYPDGSWGTKGFRKYTHRIGNTYYPKSSFRKVISDIRNIRKCSVKVANVIEMTEKVTEGCVYVYDNFVEASGAITIALCFQAQNYEIFNEVSSVFIRGINSDKKRLRPGFVPRKRVSLLTGSTSESCFNTIIELMNSPENRHGDYIKVFIASPTGNEGINLNNVVSIHIVSGDWKYSTPHQAESRAIRSRSHELLIEEKRKQVLARSRSNLENSSQLQSDARVNVNIYYHAAISRGTPAQSIDAYLYTLAESKDRVNRRVQRFMKRVAIDSYIHVSRNVRDTDKPGTIANDYFRNSHHNLCRNGENQGKTPRPEELNCETYDVHYIQEPISIILEIVLNYFKTHFSIRVGEIVSLIVKRNEKEEGNPWVRISPKEIYVHHTLEQILRDNIPIKDRFGNTCYIQKDGDLVFLSYDMDPIAGSRGGDIGYYSSHVIANITTPLKEISLEAYNTVSQEKLDELFERITSGVSQKIVGGEGLNVDLYAKLFEREVEKNPHIVTDKNHKLIEYFGSDNEPGKRKPSNYYVFREPVTEIRRLKRRLLQRERGRGRKPKCGRRSAKFLHYSPNQAYDWDTESGLILVHNLYTLQQSKTRYADKTRYFKVSGRIRIFKLDKASGAHSSLTLEHLIKHRKWKDATDVEAVVYSLLIQRELHTFRQFFEGRSLVYGYYLNDNTLTVRNKIKEDPLAMEDKRKMKVGRVCCNISPASLIEILEYFEVEPPTSLKLGESDTLKLGLSDTLKLGESDTLKLGPERSDILKLDMSKEELLEFIVKSKGFHDHNDDFREYTEDRLRYFVRWTHSSKSEMCRTVERTLRKRDLLFRTI